MNQILITLCGILMGAINFAFFCLGYYARSKKKDDDAFQVTEENVEGFKEILKWMNYGGK